MARAIRRFSIVRRLVRSFCVLPLLPQNFIMKGFRSILRLALKKNVPGVITGLASYWLHTWRPKLHILSVSGCEDRTTNCCECDNRMLQDAVREKRPNVWNFIDGVREMEDTTQQDLHVLRKKKKAVRRRSVSAVANDETIRVLTQELKDKHISVASFLKDASYTIVKALNRGLNGKKKIRRNI
ncbi:uncharacterized protein LOC127751052 [Frankliniella occidentalis]|uniref:Uncharacterized protein LOC127751052 n=1 Tax=Frankliniella occidentalis TaxID=133901 RepID=A0A9C6X6D2_FRAOC|nr:uncharacterized protein LOC127751052 [Frankliniella occidentalis]